MDVNGSTENIMGENCMTEEVVIMQPKRSFQQASIYLLDYQSSSVSADSPLASSTHDGQTFDFFMGAPQDRQTLSGLIS